VARVLDGGAGNSTAALRIEAPPDIGDIKRADRDRAFQVQQRLALEFQKAFDEGFVVTGFDKQGTYLLEKVDVPSL
jgi:predicted GNAT superfamily acetyltransferase